MKRVIKQLHFKTIIQP